HTAYYKHKPPAPQPNPSAAVPLHAWHKTCQQNRMMNEHDPDSDELEVRRTRRARILPDASPAAAPFADDLSDVASSPARPIVRRPAPPVEEITAPARDTWSERPASNRGCLILGGMGLVTALACAL